MLECFETLREDAWDRKYSFVAVFGGEWGGRLSICFLQLNKFSSLQNFSKKNFSKRQFLTNNFSPYLFLRIFKQDLAVFVTAMLRACLCTIFFGSFNNDQRCFNGQSIDCYRKWRWEIIGNVYLNTVVFFAFYHLLCLWGDFYLGDQ